MRSVRPRPARSALGVGEAVAVAVHLEDVDVMGEPVEQGAGEPANLIEAVVDAEQDWVWLSVRSSMGLLCSSR